MPIESRLRPIPEMLLDDKMRFWGYVKRLGEDDCWEWQACRVGGYGVFSKGAGNSYSAHRVSYYLAYGEPGPILVCHECNNPPCVNPKHLYRDTGSGNQRKSVLDQRHAGYRRANNAMFDDDQIRKIRKLYEESHSQVEISRLYGCTRHTINHIVSYITYQNMRVGYRWQLKTPNHLFGLNPMILLVARASMHMALATFKRYQGRSSVNCILELAIKLPSKKMQGTTELTNGNTASMS